MAKNVPDSELVIRAPLSWLRVVVGLAAGLLTGGFAAWAYYDDALRPLAHGFGLWITLLALLCARQGARRAMVQGCLALAAAVVAFYVGKKVMYGIDYAGMPYSINVSVVTEWLVLAAVAGFVFGWAFSWAGRPGVTGALGTAAVLGLLVGDAYRISNNFGAEAPVIVTFTLLAVVAVVCATVRSWSQLLLVAALVLPGAPIGYFLVSSPDLLEQLLLTSSL